MITDQIQQKLDIFKNEEVFEHSMTGTNCMSEMNRRVRNVLQLA